MKTLLSTTALMITLAAPTPGLAQALSPETRAGTQDRTAATAGFLARPGKADLFVSDLLGHDVHARRVSGDGAAGRDQASAAADGAPGIAPKERAGIDEFEAIGQINDILLARDGGVRALVIGVGGVPGAGERTLAVSMDRITFASGTGERSRMDIIVTAGPDMLDAAPVFDRTANEMAETRRADDGRVVRAAFAAPEIERDGYERIDAKGVSTGMMLEKIVYDANDTEVGVVIDLLFDGSGKVTDVIIDFGGFLSLESSQASLDFEELTILATKDFGDVRIYVDATRDRIQDLPRSPAMK